MEDHKVLSVVLVCFLVFYFAVNLLIGPATASKYDSLPHEADYEIVSVTKKSVLEGKHNVDKYALTVEYNTDNGVQQYTTPLLYGTNSVGATGVLHYGDEGVVLDIEVPEASSKSTGTFIAMLIVGAIFAYGWLSSRR